MAAFYTLLYIADPNDSKEIVFDEADADGRPSIWLKHIGDQELVRLWSLVIDSPSDVGRTLMSDLVFQGGDEGPFVMRVPSEFISALARLPADRVAEISAAWGRMEELSEWPSPELTAVVRELSEFARKAVSSGQSVLQVAHL